ncbi:MAG: glycosyltransferase [Verrucomicrobia bacterium]|nr:glycosyltransferase [Verrucomicrobiota bacterium]
MDFVFVVTGRQAIALAEECLGSIQAQLGEFSPSVIYVDDASGYGKEELGFIENLLRPVNGRLVCLKERHYQIGSLSKAVPLVSSPNSIVCLVDADDYLLPHALKELAKAYANSNVAMTYGNVLIDFRPYQDVQQEYFYDKGTVNTEYSLEVWKNRTFREDGFRCFHLRTFRRWLWDYLDPRGFLRPSGEFIKASGDSAFVYPMLEMLGDPKHVAFIEKPLYVYRLHAGNVHNHDKKSQSDDLDYLRFQMKKYPLLDRNVLKHHLQRSQLCAALPVS